MNTDFMFRVPSALAFCPLRYPNKLIRSSGWEKAEKESAQALLGNHASQRRHDSQPLLLLCPCYGTCRGV
jgi:hypothetical protein